MTDPRASDAGGEADLTGIRDESPLHDGSGHEGLSQVSADSGEACVRGAQEPFSAVFTGRAARKWIGVVLGIAVLGMLVHAIFLNCVAEDAFISFRFARHVAMGKGFVWNIGELPVEGFTNFLWVVLFSIVLKAGLEPEIPSQVAGILATAITMVYIYRASRLIHDHVPSTRGRPHSERSPGCPDSSECGVSSTRSSASGCRVSSTGALSSGQYVPSSNPVAPGSPPSAFDFLAVALMAASGATATWASSGMETSAFTFFVTLGLYYYLAGLRRGALGVGSALFLLLAALTRPEGVLVFSVLAGYHALRGISVGHPPWRDRPFLLWCAAFFGLGSIYFVWRYNYFGYPLPNTFYAKVGEGADQYARGLTYLDAYVKVFLLPWALLLPGAVLAVLRRWRVGARPASTWWLAPVLVLLVVYGAYIVFVGGDYMAMFRFIVPMIPWLYLVVQESFRLCWHGVPELRRAIIMLFLLLLGYTALPSLTNAQMRVLGFPRWAVEHYRKPALMHGYADGVETERGAVARLTLIGKFFRDYAASSQESLVTTAIGAIGYYSGITVYGAHGLVDPHIAHQKMAHAGMGLPGHEKQGLGYLMTRRPTYVMVHRGLVPDKVSKADLIRYFHQDFDESWFDDYEVVNAPLWDRYRKAFAYFPFLARKDRSGARGLEP